MTALSSPAAHFANGCLALRQLEDGCLVGGALQPDCRHESSLLAAAIEGFHARVVQHECDHLDGTLYPMRVRDFSKFGFTDVLFPELGA